MGTVYLAGRCDGVYEQKVALKLIRSGMDTPENVARFERERYILAGLSHPNIAGLIDGGVTDFGLPYLVMEYVDGRPIHTYCDEERLSVHERIRLFQTICDALQYAHNNLVIHRDLKPANILVDHTGTVKILDFGIAKLIQQGITGADQQTKTSHQVLTPCCAAPEQITGDPVTTSSDHLCVGCASLPADVRYQTVPAERNQHGTATAGNHAGHTGISFSSVSAVNIRTERETG
jgi:eukaryotic-like serine/threonine-protein kinase